MKAATVLVAAITVAVAAALAWLLLVAHPRWSIDALAGDDAGYYFAIARNIGLGLGVTFDRVTPTNGFNPLQTALLVGADRLFAPGLGVTACYRVGVGLSLVVLLIAGWIHARLFAGFLAAGPWRAETRRYALAACIAWFAWFVCLKNNFGMDGPLVLLIAGAYLLRVFRRGPLAPDLRGAIVDGALLAALFLARVDSLPFLAAAFAVLLAAAAPARRVGPAIATAAVTAALSLPYLVWSRLVFGAWLPISARIKSSFPAASLTRSLDTIRHTSLHPADQLSFLLAFSLALAFAAGWWIRRRAGSAPAASAAGRPAVLAILTLYVAGRIGYLLLFSRADVQGSYVLLAHVYLALAGIVTLEALTRAADPAARERAAVTASTALLVVSAGLLGLKTRGVVERARAITPGGAGDEVALAGAIHDRTTPRDVIYGGAFGMLAFLADRAWINGDGVANDAAYQRAIAADRLPELLRARGVSHVFFLADPPGTEGPRRLRVHSFLYGRDASLDVDARATVLRWRTLRGGGADLALARWTPPDSASAAAAP